MHLKSDIVGNTHKVLQIIHHWIIIKSKIERNSWKMCKKLEFVWISLFLGKLYSYNKNLKYWTKEQFLSVIERTQCVNVRVLCNRKRFAGFFSLRIQSIMSVIHCLALLCFSFLLCVSVRACVKCENVCVLYRWRRCICVCLTFALFFLTSFMLYCLSARHYIYIYFSLCAFPTTHRAMCSIWFWLSIRVDSF